MQNSEKPNRHKSADDNSSRITSRHEKFRDLLTRLSVCIAMLAALTVLVPAKWRTVYLTTSLILLIPTIGIRALQINYPGRFLFSNILNTSLNWYEGISRRQQLYLNVVLCIPFLIYFYLLDRETLFVPLLFVFYAYCLGVATYDICRIYGALASTLVGKGLIAISFAVGSNLAFSISGKVISELTHVPPSTFPHTLSFLAILTIPFLLVAAGAIYVPLSIFLTPIVIYASKFMKDAPRVTKWIFGIEVTNEKYRYIISTVIFQMIFYSAIGAVTPEIFLYVLRENNPRIERLIGNSIYEFDMYPGVECKMASNYRTASLGDENYVTAAKEATGVRFELPRKCAL
ncbi:hypothetical protein [Burkholderia multivorans]|uniref:hypothetical protein n=1 Tax=Burkholderia multivorans TaxID=87883 RepID=UPI0011B1E6BB|nr:hypothetical protein [Burkholderia multivorans]